MLPQTSRGLSLVVRLWTLMLVDLQMEDGTPYKRYEDGTFHSGQEEQMQDSARQPLPGQVGHCDYTPEGSDQVCPLL